MSVELDDLVMTPEEATGFYRLVGRALWAIGCFEYQLAHIIVIVFKSPFDTLEDAETALETEFRKTLGNLLKEFRRHRELAPGLDRRIDAFKAERDWLCHRMYAQNHIDFYSRKRFEELGRRLEDLKREATELGEVLDSLFERWRAAAGITDEELNKRMRATVEGWKDT